MKRDFSKLDRLLEEFASHSVPGCTCTIMQGDKAIYEGAAGYADIASGKKVNAHSMFRQASTTKLFTYAILGMLYERAGSCSRSRWANTCPSGARRRSSWSAPTARWTRCPPSGR